MTLGEIVTLRPSLAADLERRGLDYCCHGGRTLTEAAREAGLDAQTVADELSAAHVGEPSAAWARSARRLYTELRTDLEPHLAWEEQELFPMIRQLAATTDGPQSGTRGLAAQIDALATEHETVGELLDALNRTTSGYATPADGCASYTACYRALADLEADTHLHVHKENNLLFPAASAALARPSVVGAPG
jgi:regulator of cell morphogenesis and NO signaling